MYQPGYGHDRSHAMATFSLIYQPHQPGWITVWTWNYVSISETHVKFLFWIILKNISFYIFLLARLREGGGVFLIWFGSKRNKNCPCMRRNGWGVSVRFGLAKTSTAWLGSARDRKSVSKDWLFGIRWKKKSEKNSVQVSAPLLYKL